MAHACLGRAVNHADRDAQLSRNVATLVQLPAGQSRPVDLPSEADLARAQAAGESPGGDIMIHGLKNGLGWLGRLHPTSDWTEGCIAVTNDEIEEIWRHVPDGTPIRIEP